MTRTFDFTLSFAFALETEAGAKISLATRLTVLPSPKFGLWRRLNHELGRLAQAMAGALLPCPYFAG